MMRVTVSSLLFLALSIATASAQTTTAAAPPMPTPVEFTTETLDNGLQVVYAPLHNAPVVHVRVIYHVGSRDERPDRQGFAHMFEHMMFRGSAHVAPELHMKLIGEVGGISNAFTSFDETVYHDTIPSQHTQMALYLEADRMSSFKVSDEIFKTERKVVSEEWRLRNANPPYGQMYNDFTKTAFVNHSYRWTPIGDMDQLRAASSEELQSFFNKYYIPNNACLVIAGDFDPQQVRQWVHGYYSWIPRGAEIDREIAQEPVQTQERHLTVKKFVPLPRVLMGYKTTTYTSDDHYTLGLLGDILGGGRTSRLYRQLVNSASPLCVSADAGDQQQEDLSLFILSAAVLPGKNVAQVEEQMHAAVQQMVDTPVSNDELALAKTQERVAYINSRETCTQIAEAVGLATVFGHDPARVNTELAKIDAITPEMIQLVAKKYLQPTQLTTVEYVPDPLNLAGRGAAATQAAKATALATAPVVASTEPIEPRVNVTQFPKDYPTSPPISDARQTAIYNKGIAQDVDGVKVITLQDGRLPLVNFNLILRSGGYAEPAGKEGLGNLTAAMLRRGAGKLDADTLSQDLESRGITIEAVDGGDTTRISGSCTTDQLDHAIDRLREIVLQPTFPASEFAKLKQQTMGELVQQMANPATVGTMTLNQMLFGEHTPLGRAATPQSVSGITAEEISAFYQSNYRPDDAMFVLSGDVSPAEAKSLATRLLDNWKPAGSVPGVDYSLPPANGKLHITLVDNPEGRQSTIRMGIRAYDLHSADKFAGSLAGAIFSSGIDSRLNKYVRAEKGFTYGCYGVFGPTRHDGLFNVTVDTNPATTGPCIEAVWKVLNDVATGGVTQEELTEAQRRVSGGMIMDTQTIAQQATRRIDIALNGYPLDYYDKLPERFSQVTTDDVKRVVSQYVKVSAMDVIVVGPASQIQSQLEPLGDVTVIAMPLKRMATSMPSNEMMKPTTQAK